MTLLNALLLLAFGLAMLFMGRKLFWVYIGLLGFLLGLEATRQYLAVESQWLPLLIGVAVGAVSAVLAILLQYTAVGIAGFVGGAYLAMVSLGLASGGEAGPLPLLAVLFCGGLGAVLFLVLFDPALVVLSAFTGASLLVQLLPIEPAVTGVIFLALWVVGMVFQFMVLARSERPAG